MVSVDAPGGGVVSTFVDLWVEVATTSVAEQWREPPIRSLQIDMGAGAGRVGGATRQVDHPPPIHPASFAERVPHNLLFLSAGAHGRCVRHPDGGHARFQGALLLLYYP